MKIDYIKGVKMIEFFIASKHIKERKRQSIISIMGIVIGITVLTVAIAISNGLDENMIGNILSMTPHVKVTNNSSSLEGYGELEKNIMKIKGVKGIVSKYSTQGIAKYDGENGTFVSGIIIEGMTDKSARDVLGLHKKIVEGKMSLLNNDEILVGKELFLQLGAKLGDKLKIVSSENKEAYMTIVGVFQTGFYDFDTTMVIMPLQTVQIMYDAGDIVTTLDVRLDNVYDAPKVAAIINENPELTARTWGELNRNLLSALALEKNVMIIILSLLVIISGFVISVILNTLVKEKTKDIGILRSVGFSSKSIMKIFMIEGIVLGFAGIVLGIIISIILIMLLEFNIIRFPTDIYYLEKIPVSIEAIDFIKIIAAASFIIFLSSIQPAYKAAKLIPVEAMKYE